MYNQDCNLCLMCDDEPAVYRGLCAICLGEEGQEEYPEGRRLKPVFRRKNDPDEEDYYGR